MKIAVASDDKSSGCDSFRRQNGNSIVHIVRPEIKKKGVFISLTIPETLLV